MSRNGRTVSALQFDQSRASGSVVVATIEPLAGGYPDAATARLKRMPAVALVGLVATPPEARAVKRVFLIERGATREPVEIDINFASNDYFRVVQDPLLEGRPFSPDDDANPTNAVVINEALAQRYFPDRAVGGTLTDSLGGSVRIVGVVRTHSYRALEGPPRPTIFFPMTRYTARAFCAILRLRTDVDARLSLDRLRRNSNRPGQPARST